MATTRIPIWFLLTICVSLIGQPLPTSFPSSLETSTLFALGPVGFAGSISPQERQFRAILALDPYHAKQQLERLYSSGNPQAMSYALAGMREVARGRFNELLRSARASNLSVQTAHGCIYSREPLSTIAADLDAGTYDPWLPRTHPSQ